MICPYNFTLDNKTEILSLGFGRLGEDHRAGLTSGGKVGQLDGQGGV